MGDWVHWFNAILWMNGDVGILLIAKLREVAGWVVGCGLW